MQVYIDAPHISTGPLPADLPAALVNGRPTFEWWNAQRVSCARNTSKAVGCNEVNMRMQAISSELNAASEVEIC